MIIAPAQQLRASSEFAGLPPHQRAAIIELERVATYSQFARGLTPEWATRPMTPSEIASKVSFAALDSILTDGYVETAASLEDLRSALVLQLLKTVTRSFPGDAGERVGDNERAAIAAQVAAWAGNRSPAVQAAIDAAYAELAAALLRAGRLAEDELIREAKDQGQEPGPRRPPPSIEQEKTAWAAVDTVHALTAAAAVKHSERTDPGTEQTHQDVLEDLGAAVGKAPMAAAEDLGRQAVHKAFGAGRSAAAHSLPPPQFVVASELLDGATCLHCSEIDGRHYASLAAAETDYPNSVGYRHCKGEARCRGSLVLIYDEAPPGGAGGTG